MVNVTTSRNLFGKLLPATVYASTKATTMGVIETYVLDHVMLGHMPVQILDFKVARINVFFNIDSLPKTSRKKGDNHKMHRIIMNNFATSQNWTDLIFDNALGRHSFLALESQLTRI